MGVYGDLMITYPKPYSIYFRVTTRVRGSVGLALGFGGLVCGSRDAKYIWALKQGDTGSDRHHT